MAEKKPGSELRRVNAAEGFMSAAASCANDEERTKARRVKEGSQKRRTTDDGLGGLKSWGTSNDARKA